MGRYYYKEESNKKIKNIETDEISSNSKRGFLCINPNAFFMIGNTSIPIQMDWIENKKYVCLDERLNRYFIATFVRYCLGSVQLRYIEDEPDCRQGTVVMPMHWGRPRFKLANVIDFFLYESGKINIPIDVIEIMCEYLL